MSQKEDLESDSIENKFFNFQNIYPGYKFACVGKIEKSKLPMLYYKDQIPDLEMSKIQISDASQIEQNTDADDDDYKPKPKPRVTRSATKIPEKKPDLKYDYEQEYLQSDVSESSITAIEKTSKRKIQEELVASASKREKKDISPMHPTAYLKQSKEASSSHNPPLDQQFFLNMIASITANIDKKIESVIDKKLGKEQHIETKNDDIGDDDNGDTKNLYSTVDQDI
jgi:hypothetical protein